MLLVSTAFRSVPASLGRSLIVGSDNKVGGSFLELSIISLSPGSLQRGSCHGLHLRGGRLMVGSVASDHHVKAVLPFNGGPESVGRNSLGRGSRSQSQ